MHLYVYTYIFVIKFLSKDTLWGYCVRTSCLGLGMPCLSLWHECEKSVRIGNHLYRDRYAQRYQSDAQSDGGQFAEVDGHCLRDMCKQTFEQNCSYSCGG